MVGNGLIGKGNHELHYLNSDQKLFHPTIERRAQGLHYLHLYADLDRLCDTTEAPLITGDLNLVFSNQTSMENIETFFSLLKGRHWRLKAL
jgi:hypothetical protein